MGSILEASRAPRQLPRSKDRQARSSLLASAVLWVAAATNAQTLPNLIFVLSDDQGIDAIEGANWPNDLRCRTPNLAHFASQGRTFAMARVNSMCSPTRAALMTGRSALTTGVTDRIGGGSGPDLARLSLQGNEHTVAEMLRKQGYYTILVDKWHLGTYQPMGQSPLQQGFDVFFPYQDYLHLDHPDRVGDEHMTRMINLAISAVQSRPDPSKPFALFYWSYDPHGRKPDSTGKFWWKVDRSLLPSGIDYYNPAHDTNRNRYRAVVEALDTEIRRLLTTLDVVDGDGLYRPASQAVVFYMSDNGTETRVALRPNWAKRSVFEGGIRVPLFVFGHNVPGDGRILDDPVQATDFFDTVADITGASPELRGTNPRESRSYADLIGWADPRPRRSFTMSSMMRPPGSDYLYVALADRRYKLIARAGYTGFAPLNGDRFHDLDSDPNEVRDLVRQGMNAEQRAAYLRMRERIVDHWPTAVSDPTPNQVDVALTHVRCLGSDGIERMNQLPIGHLAPGRPQHVETRLFLRFDISSIGNLLPPGKTLEDVEHAQIILAFLKDNVADLENGDTGPITAHPMTLNWYTREQSWQQLSSGYDPLALGMIDLPPFVVVETEGRFMNGVPMPMGTPVSLGQDEDLLRLVRYWSTHPFQNYGLTLMARPVPDTLPDQRLEFLPQAVLRLTLRHE